MIIYKCDVCGKALKDTSKFIVTLDGIEVYDICFDCREELSRTLRKYRPRCGNCKFVCHGDTLLCGKSRSKKIVDEYRGACNEYKGVGENDD